MKYRILLFAVAMTAIVSLSSRASLQDPATTSEKPLYQPTGTETTVVGTISVKGKVPKPWKVDMSADPACVSLNETPTIAAIVANQQKLLNAFIYVKEGDGLKIYRFEVPQSAAILAHLNCQYSPHVIGLRVGQRLSIVNADRTTHNTHPTPKVNTEWNISQPPASAPLVKTFTRGEVLIPFKDNQHPWEKAYVAVLEHPFFAVSDELGNFEIRGLPSGTYKLVVWHETLGEQAVDITVVPGETRRIDFTFDIAKAPDRTKSSVIYPWE